MVPQIKERDPFKKPLTIMSNHFIYLNQLLETRGTLEKEKHCLKDSLILPFIQTAEKPEAFYLKEAR